MDNIDIEKILINDFYEMVKPDNPPQQETEKYIEKLKYGIDKIKKENNLQILIILYLLRKNIYEELKPINKKIEIKDNGLFEDVTIAMIFTLNYKYNCYDVCFEKKLADRKVTLKVPKELEETILKILVEISEEWKELIIVTELEEKI